MDDMMNNPLPAYLRSEPLAPFQEVTRNAVKDPSMFDAVDTDDTEEREEEGAYEAEQHPEEWCHIISYGYLNEEERNERRGRLEKACAEWAHHLDSNIHRDLLPLALDCLVTYAYQRAFQEQIDIGAPQKRSGAGWLRHQEEAAALASSSAMAFCRDLRVLATQQEAASLKTILYATMDWWRNAAQTGSPKCIDDLIDYSANRLAVTLMCQSASRTLQQSNLFWWTILAHRVVTRVLPEAKKSPRSMQASRDKTLGGVPNQQAVQARTLFYIQHILKTLQTSKTPFEFRTPDEAIKYLRTDCRHCDSELWHQKQDEKNKGKLPEEPDVPLTDSLSLIAQVVERTLGGEEEDKQPQHQEKQTYFQQQLWDILEISLGRKGAVRYWLLALMRQDGFEWNTIVELFDQNDCPIRYEASLPPGVTWAEMDPAVWKMKKTAKNLRKFYSVARPAVYAELVKSNAAFPSTYDI